MAGMSFEEVKNRRDSLPAWQTFEESIKSGGVTGSVGRASGSALRAFVRLLLRLVMRLRRRRALIRANIMVLFRLKLTRVGAETIRLVGNYAWRRTFW